MEDSDVDIDTYCSILKTIYLFLDSNKLQKSADAFMQEIVANNKNLEDVNFDDIPTRTVVFRPQDAEKLDEKDVIICIPNTSEENIVSTTDNKVLLFVTSLAVLAINEKEEVHSSCTANLEYFAPVVPVEKLLQSKEIETNLKTLFPSTSDRQDKRSSQESHTEKIVEGMDESIQTNFSDAEIFLEHIDEPVQPNNQLLTEKETRALNDKSDLVVENSLPKTTETPTSKRNIHSAPITAATDQNKQLRGITSARSIGEKILKMKNNIIMRSVDGFKVGQVTLETKSNADDQSALSIDSKNERGSNPTSVSDLDIETIKEHLFSGDDHRRIKLLQALRWRLTKTNRQERDYNLKNFINHDILFMRPGGNFRIFETFLCDVVSPNALQEVFARFLLAISSISIGRDYLELNYTPYQAVILLLLMNKVQNVTINTPTREFLLATVQKLSHTKSMRDTIIACGGFEWLIGNIKENHGNVSKYEAENSVALLMNLCLAKETGDRCEGIVQSVAELLMELLMTKHECCLYYLPGIFFTLLGHSSIYKATLAMGALQKLKELCKNTQNPYAYKQLETIFLMNMAENSKKLDSCDMTISPECECDYLEEELDMNDFTFENEPVGEDFLEEYKNFNERPSEESIRESKSKPTELGSVDINCNTELSQSPSQGTNKKKLESELEPLTLETLSNKTGLPKAAQTSIVEGTQIEPKTYSDESPQKGELPLSHKQNYENLETHPAFIETKELEVQEQTPKPESAVNLNGNTSEATAEISNDEVLPKNECIQPVTPRQNQEFTKETTIQPSTPSLLGRTYSKGLVFNKENVEVVPEDRKVAGLNVTCECLHSSQKSCEKSVQTEITEFTCRTPKEKSVASNPLRSIFNPTPSPTGASPTYNKQIKSEKVTSFKEMFQETPAGTYPPILVPCRLNYYYYNREEIPTDAILYKLLPDINNPNKYTCECYDNIRSSLKEDFCTKKLNTTAVGGRKANNVVYGPIKPQIMCSCRNEELPSNANSNIFQSRPKINRSP